MKNKNLISYILVGILVLVIGYFSLYYNKASACEKFNKDINQNTGISFNIVTGGFLPFNSFDNKKPYCEISYTSSGLEKMGGDEQLIKNYFLQDKWVDAQIDADGADGGSFGYIKGEIGAVVGFGYLDNNCNPDDLPENCSDRNENSGYKFTIQLNK